MVAVVAEARESLVPSVRKVEYAWKPNSRIGIKPDVAGRVLEEIEARRKGLRPLELVTEAKPPKSPLHGVFEWEDAVAAQAYRIDQAEHLLRSLVRRVSVDNQEPVETRAFVVVTRQEENTGDAERVYVHVEGAMEDSAWRREVLQRAMTELQQWRDRYHALRELADIVAVIDARLPAS